MNSSSGNGLSRVVVARVLGAVPLLLGVSLVSFLLLHAAPGSFIDSLRLQPGVTPELLKQLEEQYGLDVPWYQQYGRWLAGILQGDMGMSLRYQRPVVGLLVEAIPFSVALVVGGYLLAATLGFALALLSVARAGANTDRWVHLTGVGLASVHPIVVTLSLLAVASVTRWLPVGGVSSGAFGAGHDWLEFARHLALPVVALALVLLPGFLLQARGVFLEMAPASFTSAARARGLTERGILLGSVVPVSLGPLLAYAGAELATALNVALLVEVVMGWPGMGRLAWIGLRDRDGFLLLGALVVAACLLVLGNLIADLLHTKADPRVRMEEEPGA